jgi:hypothetical protein
MTLFLIFIFPGNSYAGPDCLDRMNAALFDFGSADGPPFIVAPDGYTSVVRSDRIVSRKVSGDIETIIYKSSVPKLHVHDGFATETNKVIIKRDKGRVVSMVREFDTVSQRRVLGEWKRLGDEKDLIEKSYRLDFFYKDGKCKLDQAFYDLIERKTSKEFKRISYDRKLCDALDPFYLNLETHFKTGRTVPEEKLKAAKKSFEKRLSGLKSEGKLFSSTTDNTKAALASCLYDEEGGGDSDSSEPLIHRTSAPQKGNGQK